jgi:hypothetical protein
MPTSGYFPAARCHLPLEQTVESDVLPDDQTKKVGSGIRSEEEPTSDRSAARWSWSYQFNMSSDHARDRAEALFKKEAARLEGKKAMAEYNADRLARRQKTSRLRALRLARDEVNKNRAMPAAKGRSALSSGGIALVSRGSNNAGRS